MTIHLFSGFLGSGKTTAIRQACISLINKGVRIGVITNDQGSVLVDGFVFRTLGIPERQVGNGCFCCRYNELDEHIGSLVARHRPEVLFAESVGTCTDLLATVLRPLKKFCPDTEVTLTTVADVRLLEMMINGNDRFDKDVRYIYFKQLEEAGVILLNKIDLVAIEVLNDTREKLSLLYPEKHILAQSSISNADDTAWVHYIAQSRFAEPGIVLSMDYDQYASGEAMMGYLDCNISVNSDQNNAEKAAKAIVKEYTRMITDVNLAIGHIKFWIGDRYKVSFTASGNDEIDDNDFLDAASCQLIVNARVQAEPEQLRALMRDALETVQIRYRVNTSIQHDKFFKPGYPRPIHRMV